MKIIDYVIKVLLETGNLDAWEYRSPGQNWDGGDVLLQHKTEPLETRFPIARRDVELAQRDTNIDAMLQERIRHAIANPTRRTSWHDNIAAARGTLPNYSGFTAGRTVAHSGRGILRALPRFSAQTDACGCDLVVVTQIANGSCKNTKICEVK